MRWKDDIPETVKEERLQRLLNLYQDISGNICQSFIGESVEVLVERKNKGGLLTGRTRCWKKVIFPGTDSLIGKLHTVKIDGYNFETLIGK